MRGSWWDGVGGGRADSEMARVLVNRVVRRGCLIFYRVEIVFFFFFDELGTGTEVTSMYRFVVVRGLLILNLLPHLFLGVFPPPLLFSLPHCASTDIIAIGSSRRARNIHSQTDGY